MTTDRTTLIKKLTLLLMVAGAFTLFASNARAMCAYNETDTDIYAEFDCGIFCGNRWEMQPGSHDCRPNKKGRFLTDFFSGGSGDGFATPRVDLQVGAHGWVEITQGGAAKAEACVYRQDGSLSSCATFDL